MGLMDWLSGKAKKTVKPCPACGFDWPAGTQVCYKCKVDMTTGKPAAPVEQKTGPEPMAPPAKATKLIEIDIGDVVGAFKAMETARIFAKAEYPRARAQFESLNKVAVEAIVGRFRRSGSSSWRMLLDDEQYLLLRVLAASDNILALDCLLHYFPDVGHRNFGEIQSDIVEYIIRIRAVQAAPRLVTLLKNKSASQTIAYCLGVLALPETRTPLHSALVQHGFCVRKGLAKAGTDFACAILAEWETRRRAIGPPLAIMTDSEMAAHLRSACEMWSNNDDNVQLELLVFDIGEELFRRGGRAEMVRVLNLLNRMPGTTALELTWRGIGDW